MKLIRLFGAFLLGFITIGSIPIAEAAIYYYPGHYYNYPRYYYGAPRAVVYPRTTYWYGQPAYNYQYYRPYYYQYHHYNYGGRCHYNGYTVVCW